jgi:sigma-B regulation protein RsbU (phosphoserine phosphatase)
MPRGVWREVGLQSAVLIEVLIFAWFVGRKIGEIESARARQNADLFSLQLELERARQVHSALLPRELTLPVPIEAHVSYRPAGALGGDYYQIAPLEDGRCGVFLADVTGHGLAAAMNASTVHIGFHSALHAAADASDLLTRMNRMFAADHKYRFVSALYLIVNPQTLEMEFSFAGHPDVLIRRSDGRLERVGQESPWLGMLPDFEYESASLSAGPGDSLTLFTDGLYEAPHEEANPSEHLIESAVARAWGKGGPLADIARDLIAEFDRLRGREAEDDVTLLLLRFRRGPIL